MGHLSGDLHIIVDNGMAFGDSKTKSNNLFRSQFIASEESRKNCERLTYKCD